MSQSEPLWTKDFIAISLVNFFLTMVFYLLIVIIGLYAVETYQATAAQAGLVAGIFILGILFGRLLIGKYIDILGRKQILILGTILFTATSLLYLVHLDLNFLVLTRFLHGAALGVASTATGTIVAQIIPKHRKGEGIGYYSLSSTLSTAIGPFLGLYLSLHASFDHIFLLCVVIAVASVVTACLVKVPEIPPLAPDQTTSTQRGFQLSNYIETSVLPIALIVLLIGFSYSSVLSYINFYAKELDLVSSASLFFLVYSIAVLISRPFTGKLMDRKNANYVMYPALGGFVLGLIILSFATSGMTLLLAGFFIGLGFGNLQSCAQTIAIKVAPVHRMGLATATFFIAIEAGLGVGPYLLGFLIPMLGYAKLYVSLAVFSMLVIVLYFFLIGRRRRELAV